MLEGLNRAAAADRELGIREREATQRYLLGLLSERNRSQLGNRQADVSEQVGRWNFDVGMGNVGARNREATIREALGNRGLTVEQALGEAENERLTQAAILANSLGRARLEQEGELGNRELDVMANQGGPLPASVMTALLSRQNKREEDDRIALEIARRAKEVADEAYQKALPNWAFGTNPSRAQKSANEAVSKFLNGLDFIDSSLIQRNNKYSYGSTNQDDTFPVMPRGRTPQSFGAPSTAAQVDPIPGFGNEELKALLEALRSQRR